MKIFNLIFQKKSIQIIDDQRFLKDYDVYNEIGKLVKEARIKKNLSIKELSQISKIPESSINSIENKNNEGLEYESKFKSRLQASFDEIKKLKEILFENKIKINEIEERIKSCELAEDLKKKNKIYKKEDKKIYEDFLFKLKDSAKEIEYRNKEIIDRIKLKEERIELLRNAYFR